MHDTQKHLTEEELILQYYGEPDIDPSIELHLDDCPDCRFALARLGETLALVDAQQLPEPLAGLEERVWTRVQADAIARRQSRFARVFDGAPRWALAGGVAVVVLVAFMVGRFSSPRVEQPTQSQSSQVASAPVAADPTERVLLVAIGDHFDRSQMVLLELLNADVARVSNIEDEQERARDLVAANRLYRQTAARSGDESVEEVLDALERVLLEIANSPAKMSARDLEALRASIEQRGILFRVRVVASEMRQREERPVAPVARAVGP